MNETIRPGPLNIEKLECISFERSKTWGKMLEQLRKNEEFDEDIALEDIETVFADDIDQEEEGSDDVDSEIDGTRVDIIDDDDALQDITNRTIISKCLTSANMLTRYGGGGDCVDVYEESSETNDAEMQDILNQTKPLLVEHERKWKEAGIERILNTFDPQKIEEKVGGWLRRNHSIYSPIYDKERKLQSNSNQYDCTPIGGKSKQYCTSRSQRCDSDTDTDSLHSMDTARYILSSRKRPDAACSKQKSSSYATKMTIKTFRLVKSKRDELHEKYACAEQEAAEQHICDLRNRRAYIEKQDRRHHSHHEQAKMYTTPRYKEMAQLPESPHSHRSCRRHQKNKCKERRRRIRQFSSSDRSSSDSSCDSPVYRSKIVHYPSSSVLCSKCCCQITEVKRHALSMEIRGKNAMLPWRREGDCRCCNDVKLCKYARHLANSSSEWIVENCDSPKKLSTLKHITITKNTKPINEQLSANKHKKTPQKCLSKELIGISSDDCANHRKKMSTRKIIKDKEAQSAIKQPSRISKKDNVVPASVKSIKVENKKVKGSKFKTTASDENDISSSDDEDFVRQLEQAKKMSLETLKSEKKQQLNASTTNRRKLTNRENVQQIPTINKVASQKKRLPLKRQKDNDSISDHDSVLARGLSSSTKYGIKSRKLGVLHEESSTINGNDNTFFANSAKIYNSTALSNISAGNRPFNQSDSNTIISNSSTATIEESEVPNMNTTKRKVKSVEAVSTTNRSAATSINTTKSKLANCTVTKTTKVTVPRTTAKTNTDNDCTTVSSTTGYSTATEPEILKESKLRKSLERKEMPSTKATHPTGDILLYTPHDKTLAPANAVTNGCFIITKDHLNDAIGQKLATKFFKYYTGPRKFGANFKVFYHPPKEDDACDTSGSEDGLDGVLSCGCLYATFAD